MYKESIQKAGQGPVEYEKYENAKIRKQILKYVGWLKNFHMYDEKLQKI